MTKATIVVPTTKDDLLIEALRHANTVSVLLNDIAAEFSRLTGEHDDDPKYEAMHALLIRRLSDCSGVGLFLAASNIGLELPEDLQDSAQCRPRAGREGGEVMDNPMSVVEAIVHAEAKASSSTCGGEHAQLAVWLRELLALRVERDTLAAQVREMQWRSIETAPKDGSYVLCHRPGKNPIALHWSHGKWRSNGGDAYEPTYWMSFPALPAALDAKPSEPAPTLEICAVAECSHRIDSPALCLACDHGQDTAEPAPKCPTCRGEGVLPHGSASVRVGCPTCYGTGRAKL